VNTPREATSGRKGIKTPKRKASTPGAAEPTPAKAAPRADKAEVGSKKKKGKGVGAEMPTPARTGTAARARPTGTPAKPASTVRPVGQQAGGRKTAGGKAANPKGAGAGVPPLNQPPGKNRRKKAAIRKRLPRTSAVGLTAASVGGREAPKMKDIMRRAREAIPDYKVYGIKWIKPKRMATGGLLLEIPGAASSQQADALASRLREVFSEEAGLRVTRPVRRVELRIAGFEDSIAPQEIASRVSEYGAGCPAEDVRVGAIRTSRDGLCTVWVQAPAIVGLPLSREDTIDLGWFRCRVALLNSRPLKCFRCLAPGHVQQRCPCPVDRSRCCYNCGEPDHVAAMCRNRPHCPACAEKKRRVDHRPGSVDCAPIAPRRDIQPPPLAVSRWRGRDTTERRRYWRLGDCPQSPAGGRREHGGGGLFWLLAAKSPR